MAARPTDGLFGNLCWHNWGTGKIKSFKQLLFFEFIQKSSAAISLKRQKLTTFSIIKLMLQSISLGSVCGTGCEQFEGIPKHWEGETDEETEGSAKIRNQGIKGIDEILLQDSGADGSIGNHNAKCVDVLVVDCLNRILMECTRQKTPCAFLDVLLVSGCQF